MLHQRQILCAVGLLFIAIVVNGNPDLDKARQKFRVAHGKTSVRHQFKGLAFLFSGGTMCTGSFIARDLVITAAHCMCSTKPMNRVFSGLINIDEIKTKSYVQSYDIKSFEVLPGYASSCENMKNKKRSGLVHGSDIALIRVVPSKGMSFEEMDKNPEYSQDIQNISLGLYPISFDKSYTIVGFGKDENNALGQLKFGSIVPMPCPKRMDGSLDKGICHDVITEKSNLQTTLEGDSGGPLLDNNNSQIMGVTSGRMAISSGKEFGVHASVYNNWDAIQESIKKLYEGEKSPF